jgi:DNA-binding response OmpR family regulator
MERRLMPRPQTVLIVDDSPDMRELWRLWLTFWGFHVEEARNGAEGVQKTRTFRPHVVLMDLWMPVLDGFRAIRLLKADATTADVRVLALSADGYPPAPEHALEAGADVFLEKPVDPNRLLDEIRLAFRRVLGRRVRPAGEA